MKLFLSELGPLPTYKLTENLTENFPINASFDNYLTPQTTNKMSCQSHFHSHDGLFIINNNKERKDLKDVVYAKKWTKCNFQL